MLREHWDHFFKHLWDKLRKRTQIPVSPVDSPPPPWDAWDLDPKFFKTLSRWTRDNPENSLDRVLERICIGIENGQPLIQVIPDHPFPARGLVTALAHLVKLGATVSKSRRDVQRFAIEIVHWVGEVKSAFEQGGGGHFTSKTRQNLGEIRALIDEICKWATARLNDGRWSRIGHGLIIETEINEFQSRITKARAIFRDLAVINLAQGQDEIIQSIRDLVAIIQQTQREQLSSILDELEAQKAALEAQKQAEARHQFLSQTLSRRAVANTAYDDQGKRPCDSDTRIDVLADIKKWVYDISENSQSFLWLTGDPGSGKSSITASVARECKDNGILWAQFFINRNIGDTTNPASYFPSIARQLADHSPDVALAIHDALKERPSLMDDISQHQAGKLFVESIKVASSINPSMPVVVIIDGLDETDSTRLRYTAEIFSQALVDLPHNSKVFISSRTEDEIRKPFSDTFRMEHVKHVHLDTTTDSSIQDVSTFLVRNIAEIVQRNGLDVLEWPGEEQMKALCNRASGLFIWAVTVIKFIQEEIASCGRECLNDVFNELNINGMDDINVLYDTILQITHKRDRDPWAFERFRQIVGCVVVLQKPLCLADISSLLDLRNPTSNEAVDVEHHVRRLRTILVAGTDAIDGQTIPRLHKSFFEFITSERADSHFRVNMDTSHGHVARQCLRQLAGLSIKQPSDDCLPAPLRYACEFWTLHIPGMLAGVAITGSSKLPNLQELSGLSSCDGGHPLSAHVTLSSDRTHFFSSLDDSICLWDANSGAHCKIPDIGHTNTVSSVMFSPDSRYIVSGSWDHTLRLWGAYSGQPIGSPFEGHTSDVRSVAFSPDSRQIISGSEDNTLCLWDAQSGHLIGSPFKGHTDWVYSVAYSPDGKQIVSGSKDNTLRLWDSQNGQPIGSPLKGHIEGVLSVSFSPDGKHIVSGSMDNTLCLWDAYSGQLIRSPFKGHSNYVWSVAFSPDGNIIVSGSEDCTLRLWDAYSGQPIGSPIKGHSSYVYSVAFSPDGGQIISGSWDCTVRLWDTRSGQSIGSPIYGHTGCVRSVAFSPDGKQILSGSEDHTLFRWDIASGQKIDSFEPFQAHTDRVTAIALSPDSKIIVSASLDNTVHIWNAQTGLPVVLPLEYGTNGIISFAFSPNGHQLATCSLDGTICLWDITTCNLLASYQKRHINVLTSITFSSDGKLLMTSCIDGSTYTWDASSGQPQSSEDSLLPSSKSLVFSMEQGWKSENDILLQCFPVDNIYFGHWAYIDGKVIQSDKPGSTTIIDMTK